MSYGGSERVLLSYPGCRGELVIIIQNPGMKSATRDDGTDTLRGAGHYNVAIFQGNKVVERLENNLGRIKHLSWSTSLS